MYVKQKFSAKPKVMQYCILPKFKVDITLEQRKDSILITHQYLRKFCWVIRTEPLSALKIFLLSKYPKMLPEVKDVAKLDNWLEHSHKIQKVPAKANN